MKPVLYFETKVALPACLLKFLTQRQKFTLSHFIYKTETGGPASMAYAFLSHLHHGYPRLDTHIENIQANDPHLPGFYIMGYVESFRRIEMWRGTSPD